MFTGIVAGTGRVADATDRGGARRLVLALPGLAEGLAVGASVSVSGVCLTAVEVGAGDEVRFDVIGETLRRTTLGALVRGDLVNIERAAKFGDEIGGHLLSGHVIGTGGVVAREEVGENLALTVAVPRDLLRYVLPKGFIAVDGASLTIGEVAPGGDLSVGTFRVYLIPETRRRTTLGAVAVGGRVNVEVDAQTQAIVDTVERVLAARG